MMMMMMKYFSTIGYIFVPNGWMTPDPTTKEWRLMWYSNRGWLDQNIVTPNNPHQHSKCWVALLSMKHVLMYVPNIYLLSHQQQSHHAWCPWQIKQIEREWMESSQNKKKTAIKSTRKWDHRTTTHFLVEQMMLLFRENDSESSSSQTHVVSSHRTAPHTHQLPHTNTHPEW